MADILLVGADRDRAGSLKPLLRRDGHRVTWVRDPAAWPATEHEVHPEVIVAAVESPEGLLAVQGSDRRRFPAPILFVQHESDLAVVPNPEGRLVDRVSSPFMAEELLARVDALAKVRRLVVRGPGAEPAASTRGGWAGLGHAVRRALSGSAAADARPPAPYLEVAARLADWADQRDMFEPGHAGRVASFCAMMADGVDLPDHEVGILLRAAMLHDVGKVTLPVELLRRRGPLDEEQMRQVRTHPQRGAALIRALDASEEVARAVLYHHERPDGNGYYRRAGDAVPRSSRLLAVAEAFDAMTAARWCEPVSHDRALGMLRERRGEAFDAEAVDALDRALAPRSPRVAVQV